MSASRIFQMGRPLIMAHRGDPEAGPENSISALRNAVEVGCDVLETDLRLTRDRQCVLFHDETLDRCTGYEGKVSDMDLDELLQMDLGYSYTPDDGETYPFRYGGAKIVTLEEAFTEFPNMSFNLDIKDENPDAPKLLASEIEKYDMGRNVIVGSFHEKQLERFRQIAPSIPTSAHPGEVSRFVFAVKMYMVPIFARKREYQAFQVPLKYGKINIIDEKFIKAAHKKNIAIHVWTINDKETMEWLVDLEVDGIFTDKPRLLRELLQEKGFL